MELLLTRGTRLRRLVWKPKISPHVKEISRGGVWTWVQARTVVTQLGDWSALISLSCKTSCSNPTIHQMLQTPTGRFVNNPSARTTAHGCVWLPSQTLWPISEFLGHYSAMTTHQDYGRGLFLRALRWGEATGRRRWYRCQT